MAAQTVLVIPSTPISAAIPAPAKALQPLRHGSLRASVQLTSYSALAPRDTVAPSFSPFLGERVGALSNHSGPNRLHALLDTNLETEQTPRQETCRLNWRNQAITLTILLCPIACDIAIYRQLSRSAAPETSQANGHVFSTCVL